MLIKRSPNGIDLPYSSEITPRAVFESRRAFIRQLAVGSIAGGALLEMASREAFAQSGQKLAAKPNPSFVVMDKQTAFKDASTYNNYYEFGTDKADPARNAGSRISGFMARTPARAASPRGSRTRNRWACRSH